MTHSEWYSNYLMPYADIVRNPRKYNKSQSNKYMDKLLEWLDNAHWQENDSWQEEVRE